MEVFTDQIALVTGASSGIGQAIALALAAQGAVLCLVGRRVERLKAVADSLPATAARVECYRADLTQDQDIRALAASLARDCGALDLLIHSAGVYALGAIEAAPVEDFDWQYRTNVRAPYLITQALLPMLRSRRGQVVFMNSTAGTRAPAHVGQYAATKHALKAIADSLREEVNTDSIRVLSVMLGRTATPMQAAICEMEGRTYRPELLLQPEDVAAVVINALSLPRSAEVTDISIRPLIKSY
jgi:NADP-dependent 3-hydroxy acid dehydrogenase YdfG